MNIQKEIIVPAAIQPYIFGRQDSNIKNIERNLHISLSALGDNVTIIADNNDDLDIAVTFFDELIKTDSKRDLSSEVVAYALKMVTING